MAPDRHLNRRRPRALVFDEAPWLYDRSRPGYPSEAIDALVELASLTTGSDVLEVGSGTGQLTVPLIHRGMRVTAIEPGPRMAGFLSRRLSAHPGAAVVPTRFEEFDPGSRTFDAVLAATSFHWVDPGARYELAARVLKRDGRLGIIRNDHALSSTSEPYYRGVSDVYRRVAPELGPPWLPPSEAAIPSLAPEMVASNRFTLLREMRFGWDHAYSTEQLLAVLRTYSNHRLLSPTTRRALLTGIRTFVDDELGGTFIDRYVTTVCVGQRTRRRPRIERTTLRA